MYPQIRLRRNRTHKWCRNLLKETSLLPQHLILPIFIKEGKQSKELIPSMFDIYRYSIDEAITYIKSVHSLGIQAIALFPVVSSDLKTLGGEEAHNPENLICRAIKEIKNSVPDIGIIADVALDPYTSHGHDGILSENNEILNDETIEVLFKQALVQAAAGCDIIAPSDMMDGRIGIIRQKLDDCQFQNVKILSYSAKYASHLYSPFRDAIKSKTKEKISKATYQMDFHNSKEALLETITDIEEGADMVMVKPASLYLDVIQSISQNSDRPVFAYHVSGEYSLVKCAEKNGLIDSSLDLIYENLIAIKRAGANAILTYAADQIVHYLSDL